MLSQENKIQLHEGWQLVRCQDVIDVRDGTHDTPKYVSEGIPLITSKNLTNGFIDFSDALFISEDDHQKIKKRSQVDEGDIIMPMIGTIGNPVIVKSKREFSVKNVALFKFNNNSISSKYFYYLLQSPVLEKIFLIDSRGVTQKFVSLQMLRDLQIPLPPIAEQKRIAAICAKADRLRRSRRYALELSDTYLRSVFLEMFGDPIENSKGWDIENLGEISQVQGGLQVTPRRDVLPIKAPYLRVANVYRNYLELGEIKQIGLTEDELVKVKLEKNDVLIIEGHGNTQEIGRCAVWNGSISPCVHQNHIIRVRADSKSINSLFLSHYINGSGGKKYFHGSSNTTSGLNTISTGIVKDCPIFLPPLPLQEKFAAIVQKSDRIRAQQREALRQAEHLFQTILHRAFRDNGL
ncbi:MAG: restriction endonuclease subunit S [Pseudanabaena frigida]|uniref:Restriction endonuclease subunit S n=1 Tax=Pseudanabaena frigida TaxID=945775 RepID=A0A2W4Y9L6_9CYAN|nr:MAG: restriction endonuclease subunit S [Pseudanabaena frigida]